MLTKLFVNAKLALENYKNDDRGVTAIEYGLIAAGISIVIASLVGDIGTELSTIFTSIKTELSNFNK
ncbi:Flp family type IVb pilin [Vibrio europaeus]|uniref:Flp family type IVb pilin n=1 Tax=Vibrio europaeus TaxID=300876 RepID=A0A178JDW0_9VIBR|nr:Flp family type IVb pilin [Vibrio europaeus]MDC5707533.1 Flp family type IVb pilin [Vibrio europaeus]MDC5709779.1 Flp family type IVb pilin [Vibrio europaeus]MDC5716744.1 Flp family type IVb pilin [Vibrio europaeus]MDC5722635.1 Flp family type IVb pilin [Vibrio europaeus]MDC5727064.1 Flp family type IVb pilin [Vibrio europaeus]